MRIVLGVTGGIAAYKAAELARLLLQQGHTVQVVMTRSAREFIQPLTFAALTGRKVITELFDHSSPEATLSSSVEHIGVAQEHDLLVIAPASANTLAKLAHGLADDFLSTMYLAFRGPVVIAPAMNNVMWEHAATQANVSALRALGHILVEPADGYLACGTYGPGRLAEPAVIADAVERVTKSGSDLAGQTFLITAGPTQEPLDPVRYLSNRSSGKMGYALAEAALERGAKVILVSGPVAIRPPRGAEVISIRTAAEMLDAVMGNLERASVVIKCAAVADFKPAVESAQKIKKSQARLSLELEPTVDILATVGKNKGNRLLVGFAAETQNLREEAHRKLTVKNCDMVVANLVGGSGTGFEAENNAVVLAMQSGEFVELPKAPKIEIARQIIDVTAKIIDRRMRS